MGVVVVVDTDIVDDTEEEEEEGVLETTATVGALLTVVVGGALTVVLMPDDDEDDDGGDGGGGREGAVGEMWPLEFALLLLKDDVTGSFLGGNSGDDRRLELELELAGVSVGVETVAPGVVEDDGGATGGLFSGVSRVGEST